MHREQRTRAILALIGLLLVPVSCGDSSSIMTIGSGGNIATGGAGTEGGAGTGGGVGAGGNVATGGAGTGGAVGTGGTTSTPEPATYDGGAQDTPSTSGCSCAGQTTTWDCYCQAFDCSKTLATYDTRPGRRDGGFGFSGVKEYAGCNLVVIDLWSPVDRLWEVFDKTSGKLVGARLTAWSLTCPFGSVDGNLSVLSAGQFP